MSAFSAVRDGDSLFPNYFGEDLLSNRTSTTQWLQGFLFTVLQSYKFAGVHSGKQCVCGQSFDLSKPELGCKTPCAGNGTELCGMSYWAVTVVHTGEQCWEVFKIQVFKILLKIL